MTINLLFSIVFIVCSSSMHASGSPTHFLSDYTRGDLSAIAISGMQSVNSPVQEIVIFSDSSDAVEMLSKQIVRFTLTKNNTNGLWGLHYKEDDKVIASLDNFNGDVQNFDGLYYFLNKSLSEDFRDKFYQSMKIGQNGCLIKLAQSVQRDSSEIVFEGNSSMSFWRTRHAGGSKTASDISQQSHFPSRQCPDVIYNQILAAQKKPTNEEQTATNIGGSDTHKKSSYLTHFSTSSFIGGFACGLTIFALLLLILHHKGMISYNLA